MEFDILLPWFLSCANKNKWPIEFEGSKVFYMYWSVKSVFEQINFLHAWASSTSNLLAQLQLLLAALELFLIFCAVCTVGCCFLKLVVIADMHFSSSVLKLDRKFKSSWKMVVLYLVPSEQKLLKSNNVTCSLTDFSIKWWITYHQTITAPQWYISFQVLCDYEQLEHLILAPL